MESYQPPPSSQPPKDGRFGLRYSVPSRIPHHHQPLAPASFLLRAALISPNKYAVVHPEKQIRFTYSQWAARCLSLTFALMSTPNWQQGARVAVIAPNTPMILEAHHAILSAGGIDSPLNYRNSPDEIRYILDHSGASVILVDYEFKHLVPSDTRATVIVSNDTGGRNGIDSDPYEKFLQKGRDEWNKKEAEEKRQFGDRAKRGWELIDIIPDENMPSFLCYTSGTTGKPKGVVDSHRGTYLAAVANAYESQLTDESIYLWVLPAFHAAGWTYPFAVTAARAQHYILRKVDNDQIWNALLNHGVTHYCGAPTVNIGLVNSPKAKRVPRPVTVAVAASAPTADLLAKMEALNLQPFHTYGMTETRGPITRRVQIQEWKSLPIEERARKMSSQGTGFLTVDEVRVVRKSDKSAAEEDNDERNLVDVEWNGQEVGEIIMRGNLMMLEYYKDPAATKKTIRNGWLHSGDLAVRLPDGAVHIRDREKDIIITGGENVSSLAVEAAIADFEEVLECCVIAAPSEKWGEIGHAFLVPKAGKKEVNIEKLRQHLRNRISKFAVPQAFETVSEIPKTSTGKVQKNVLRERVRKEVKSKL